jgi:hypothetical protein
MTVVGIVLSRISPIGGKDCCVALAVATQPFRCKRHHGGERVSAGNRRGRARDLRGGMAALADCPATGETL